MMVPSTLLPQATIAVYSTDQSSLSAVSALSEDWHFGRVDISTYVGDVEKAIVELKLSGSPDLIIVQSDVVDEAFLLQLEELAGCCDEGTIAIVVGADNDVQLYRDLIDMGVDDYLVAPLDSAVLADVISKALIDKLGAPDSRLIAVAGAKGGVGASTLSQCLAWGAADILDMKVALLDAAGGNSVLPVGVGFEPATTLLEASIAAQKGDEDSLSRMFFSPHEKLDVLASGADKMLEESASAEGFEKLLDVLMEKHPLVIVDLSSSPADLMRAAIARAEKIIVVSTPTLPALRFARGLIQEVRDLHGGEELCVDFVLNKIGIAKGVEVLRADAEKALGQKASVGLPYNPKMFMECESKGQKITDSAEGRKFVTEELLPLIDGTVADAAPQSGGMFGGLMNSLGLGA